MHSIIVMDTIIVATYAADNSEICLNWKSIWEKAICPNQEGVAFVMKLKRRVEYLHIVI